MLDNRRKSSKDIHDKKMNELKNLMARVDLPKTNGNEAQDNDREVQRLSEEYANLVKKN